MSSSEAHSSGFHQPIGHCCQRRQRHQLCVERSPMETHEPWKVEGCSRLLVGDQTVRTYIHVRTLCAVFVGMKIIHARMTFTRLEVSKHKRLFVIDSCLYTDSRLHNMYVCHLQVRRAYNLLCLTLDLFVDLLESYGLWKHCTFTISNRHKGGFI